jgi:predicted phage terminase large subunit-like protein
MSLNLYVKDPREARTKQVTEEREAIMKIAKARWLARTNMYYLCNKVLGYKDVRPDVHYGLVRTLQTFPLPAENEWFNYDKPVVKPDGSVSWAYKPVIPNMLDLPGPRRRLILDFRGSLKTSTNVEAHTIQWLLNYPDARILVIHAKEGHAQKVLMTIKSHFATNEQLRMLFPDVCPTEEELKHFGNASEFYLPSRPNKTRREPSVGTSSIESTIAGMHFDILKFTDCVESENSANKDRRDTIAYKFGMFRPILVSPQYWIDVEGTRYHFDDLYGRIIDGQKQLPVERRSWSIYVRGCYKKKLPPGVKDYAFLPEELELPDLKDADGKPISWWPARVPVDTLLEMENDPAQSKFEFNSQYRNHPVGDTEASDFPASVVQYVPADIVRKIPMEYYATTVDTAETTNENSNYSVVTTCGWDSNNRCYVVDVRRDKMKPDELASAIFEVYAKWRPIVVRIEETSYSRGFRFGLEREMHLKRFSIPLDFVKPDNQKSKLERIRLTLQPVLRRGDLRFSEGLPSDVKEAIYQEFTQFPKGVSDDILDTLADQFQNKSFYGRIRERETFETMAQKAFNALVQGLENPYANPALPEESYYSRTGGL